MDPLAHTLFGAALAESGLKDRTRYATVTLLIGANLPDVDAVAGLWGGDFELYARRGHTHGVLALVILPLLLAGAVHLWHRWRTRTGAHPRAAGGTLPPDALSPPFKPRALLALAFLAVLTHPLLDWLNTYGVRLLMPFDGRWFYGDTLFIVDPWFWVLTAAGVVLARSSSRGAIAGWLVLAAMASALVLATSLVSPAVKVIWCGALAAIVTLRAVRPRWAGSVRVARSGLLLLFLYIGIAFGLGRMAESAWAAAYPDARRVQASPEPAVLHARRIVIEEPDRYVIVTARGQRYELVREPANAIVEAALASPSIRGFVNWMRLPWWMVEDAGDDWRVVILDLRYQGPDIPYNDIGRAEVLVPKSPAGTGP
jgi:inner membrane protein